MDKESEGKKSELAALAGAGSQGILSEFWAFFRHNKKWWLIPIVVVLLLVAVLVALAGTSAAPFIYTVF